MAIASSMAFVTLSTAYAVVIHLAGKRLPGFFLWAFSLGYSLYAALPVLGNFRALNESLLLQAKLEALRAGVPIPDAVPAFYLTTVILVYFWLLCIAYTVYVRRST
jgi:hypothetical protein